MGGHPMSFAQASLLSLAFQLSLIGVYCQPSTSLYIPGFEPQPVSADIVGVGSDGRTTWILHQGKPDATDTSSYGDFFGTATLVEGPNDASLTYANPNAQFTIGQMCTFSESTLAICILVAQGSTATQTEVVTHLPIQGGATLTGSTTITTSTRVSPTDASSTSLTPMDPSSDPTLSQTGTSTISTGSSNSSRPRHSPRGLRSQIVVLGAILLAFSDFV